MASGQELAASGSAGSSGMPAGSRQPSITIFNGWGGVPALSPSPSASAGIALQPSPSIQAFVEPETPKNRIYLSAGGEADFRPTNKRYKETNFIKRLLESASINIFVQKLLFELIKKAKELGLSKEHIINNLQIKYAQKIDVIYIKLVGLLAEEANDIYDVSDFETFMGICKSKEITLTQIMGSIFNFQTDPEFLRLCIESTAGYKEKFMTGVQKYLNVSPDIPYEIFKRDYINKIEDSPGPGSVYYWIWYYFTTDVKNLFFINQHRVLNYATSDKGRFDTDQGYHVANFEITSKNPKFSQFQKVLGKRKVEIDGEEKDLDVQAVAGNIFSAPAENSVWRRLMEVNKKEVISGPSGSAAVLFRFFFETTRILDIRNITHMIYLLLAITAQFSILFHSIPEILQMYMDCVYVALGAGVIPKYIINSSDDRSKPDEVDYILLLINKFIPDLWVSTFIRRISNSTLEVSAPIPARPPTRLDRELVENHSSRLLPPPSRSQSRLAQSRSQSALPPRAFANEFVPIGAASKQENPEPIRKPTPIVGQQTPPRPQPQGTANITTSHGTAASRRLQLPAANQAITQLSTGKKKISFKKLKNALTYGRTQHSEGGFRKTKVKRRVHKRRTRRHRKK